MSSESLVTTCGSGLKLLFETNFLHMLSSSSSPKSNSFTSRTQPTGDGSPTLRRRHHRLTRTLQRFVGLEFDVQNTNFFENIYDKTEIQIGLSNRTLTAIGGRLCSGCSSASTVVPPNKGLLLELLTRTILELARRVLHYTRSSLGAHAEP